MCLDRQRKRTEVVWADVHLEHHYAIHGMQTAINKNLIYNLENPSCRNWMRLLPVPLTNEFSSWRWNDFFMELLVLILISDASKLLFAFLTQALNILPQKLSPNRFSFEYLCVRRLSTQILHFSDSFACTGLPKTKLGDWKSQNWWVVWSPLA